MVTGRNLREHFGARAFARHEAISAGFSHTEVDAAELHRPYRGIRAFEAPNDVHSRCGAYAVKMSRSHAYTGTTAAILRGWPIPLRLRQLTEIDVAGPHSSARRREHGVRFVRVADERWSTVDVDGHRVVSPELALLALARLCTLDELVVIGDAAITTSTRYPGLVVRGTTTRHHIEEVLESCPKNVPGTRLLRRALALMREGVDSPMETLTRLKIVAAGLPEPEVAGEIWEDGVRIATGDLVFRAARVIVEYDGEYHRQEDAWERDIERIRRLERYGWKVIRVTKRGLFPTADRFLDDLRAALRERGGLER